MIHGIPVPGPPSSQRQDCGQTETEAAARPLLEERVLIIAPVGQDAPAMAELLHHQHLHPHICAGPAEAAREMVRGAGALMLTEEALALPQLPDLQEALRSQPPWSELPLIILTSGGEPQMRRLLDLTAEAAHTATLLERPLGSATLIGSVGVALNSRRRQYQVRDLLAEQESSRRKLQEGEERLRGILESITDGFHVLDENWRFTYFNKAGREMFAAQGTDVDKLLGARLFVEALPETLDSEAAGALLRTMKERVATSLETFYKPWGRWLYIRNFPAADGGVATFFQDVTERKEREQALRESEGRLRLFIEHAPASIAMFDRGMRYLAASHRWAEDYRLAGDLRSRCHYELSPEVPERWKKVHERAMAGEIISAEEDAFVRMDGTVRWRKWEVRPWYAATGEVGGILIAAEDVTSRVEERQRLRQAKEQAEGASRAKDNFLAALSHELRTPLNPVLMTASALAEDPSLSHEVRDQLAMIERNVALEARLIDDLLDLTRITRGKLTLHTEVCDINSLIGLVVEILRDEALEKQIAIHVELTAGLSNLTGDAARLQQVFWNLLRNAVKFTAAGGHVYIRSRNVVAEGRAEPAIRVEVADDGIGVDAATKMRIFEPFEQAAQGPEHRFGGLGLGLAIARAIVDLHHGSIQVESEGLGHGSTFSVDLPGAHLPPQKAGPPATLSPVAANGHGSPPPGPSLRLLVVEDHEATLQVLSRLLTHSGHRVTGATRVVEARAAAAAQPFDALISDLGLPDGTGIELMEELRDRYGLRGIVLSGYGMEEDLRRSREAGFLAHLVKPIDINELRRALQHLAAAIAGDGT